MKRIAIFAEGHTELIFIRNLLLRVVDPSKLSFECCELISENMSHVPYRQSSLNPETHFLIVTVGGDEKVVSAIRDREKDLVERGGYDRIIGLRDMYCDAYTKRSPGRIDDQISNLMIQRQSQTIRNMRHSDIIKLFFAIMEIEAWFLGMYDLFRKNESVLTVGYIKEKLGIDLMTTDPQKEFYRPSDQVNSIFQLCGRDYKKRQDEVESICSRMDSSDFEAARENGRCSCFNDFYEELFATDPRYES